MKKQDVSIQGVKTNETIPQINFFDIQPMTVKITDYIDLTDIYEIGVFIHLVFQEPPATGSFIVDFYEFDDNIYSILSSFPFSRQTISFNNEVNNEYLLTLKLDVSTQKYIKIKFSNSSDKVIQLVETKFVSSLI